MHLRLEPAAPAPTVDLDPLSLALHASGPVAAVLFLLIAAAVGAWAIAVIKHRQLGRWIAAEDALDLAVAAASDPDELTRIAARHPDAPGAPVLAALARRRGEDDVLEAVAARAQVDVQRRLGGMMTTLASIGSSAPFVGLFGTVYGIMDAFLRIGREKSATLPVVAPAIGEALIATAVGLFAAIPAVIAYNALIRRIDELQARIDASAREWAILVRRPSEAVLSERDLEMEAI